MRAVVLSMLVLFLATRAIAAPEGVAATPHNLAVVGDDKLPLRQQEVCIRCHTPHVSAPVAPLWDPDAQPLHNKIFQARAADANPDQPTGSSKLCLVCHDGAMAAGDIVSRNQPIQAAGRLTSLSREHPIAKTDLSDDHPISFLYNAALASKTGWLKDPAVLVPEVSVDANSEVQCMSCHDPHDNTNKQFLTKTNTASELCNSCHQMGATTVVHHMNCTGCHEVHTAPSGSRLLKQQNITATCLSCHSGKPAEPQGPNIGQVLRSLTIHDTAPPIDLKTHVPDESTCTDCHDPHTMKTFKSVAPSIRGNFGEIAGVNARGVPVKQAMFEYEVCFKCHADKTGVEPQISRVVAQNNLRLKFQPSAVSFHPVIARGVNPAVPSLRIPLNTGSIIYCTDCHSSDSGKKADGSGASGPHGSDVAGLLIERYDTTDYTAESAQAYALCYRCHERSSILSNQSFDMHQLHVVKQKAPCSACHDPHGIAAVQGTALQNSHLINFDLRIVRKSSLGTLEYNSTGVRSGSCTLTCHGVDHQSFSY